MWSPDSYCKSLFPTFAKCFVRKSWSSVIISFKGRRTQNFNYFCWVFQLLWRGIFNWNSFLCIFTWFTIYGTEMTPCSTRFGCFCNVVSTACLLNCSCLDASRIIKRFIGLKQNKRSSERINNESNRHQSFLILQIQIYMPHKSILFGPSSVSNKW